MDASQFTYATCFELAALIREREISALELLEAHLARIAQLNADINAIITLDAEGARRKARAADSALARGENWGPLHGVPFTLKDSHSTAGVRTTAGYSPLADYIPTADGTVSERLQAAGAVLMGKTNVSVLLGDIQSHNPIFGRTRNPWNVQRTSGGSSGGAAAAIAAGLTPFDFGTDIGGSIRLPAHFCGIFGLKATERRISFAGHIPGLPGTPRSVRLMESAGPMARSVEDLELLYRLVAGPDGRDTEVPPVPLEPSPSLELSGLRIAVAPTFPGFPVAPSVSDAILTLAKELRSGGATIDETALPAVDFQRQLVAARRLTAMMIDAFEPAEETARPSLPEYLQALHERDQAIATWEQFFHQWDVLLCPASAVTAFAHCQTGAPLPGGSEEVDYWWANAHCKLFNYSGHPAIVLPYSLDGDGLPLGVQLVGRRWGESRLLGVAAALAQVTGPFRRPPGY